MRGVFRFLLHLLARVMQLGRRSVFRSDEDVDKREMRVGEISEVQAAQPATSGASSLLTNRRTK